MKPRLRGPTAYCSSLGGGGGGSSLCLLTDADGNTIKQDFDIMGRVVAVTDSLSHAMFTQYDTAGRKTQETDANGNATKYGYDEAGRLVNVIEASGAVTQYTYDKNGNKLTQKDANGHVWTYAYDPLNRLTKETDPLGRAMSYAYDALGNLKTKTDGKGQATTYSYNVRRMTAIAYADGSADNFTYDSLGRRTGMANANVSYTYVYDSLNRVVSLANARTNFRTAYEYDAAGNRTKLSTYVQGSSSAFSTTQNVYDAKNRLTSIKDSVVGTFGFNYDAMDRRTSLQYPNGVTTSYAYDNAYRLTAIAAKDALGNVADAWSYQYDATGNRTSKTDMSGAIETYAYDNVYRLTKAAYGDGTAESFTYDPAGNRLARTDQSGTTAAYSYDLANQLLRAGSDTFTYDANGNMLTKATSAGTTTLTYNPRNLPTTVAAPDGTETNRYGPMGERMDMLGASIENGEVYPEYDLSGNPFLDTDGGLGVWTYRVYGPGVDEPLAEYRRNNGRTTYLHHDALGSVTAVSNTAGQVAYRSTYKAFGQMSRTGYDLPTTRLGYTSRETSVGGLMQYRSRYYDSGTGRFLQQDIRRGNEATPPSLDRYVYVFNNPVLFVDPTGNYAIPLGVAAALLFGLVAISIVLLNTSARARAASMPTLTGILHDLRSMLDTTLGSIRLLAAFAQWHYMLIASASVIRFPTGERIQQGTDAIPLEEAPPQPQPPDDECDIRLVRSLNMIDAMVPPGPGRSALMELASKMWIECKYTRGTWVRFPFEGPGPVPPLGDE